MKYLKVTIDHGILGLSTYYEPIGYGEPDDDDLADIAIDVVLNNTIYDYEVVDNEGD